jgi:hypothetical protein
MATMLDDVAAVAQTAGQPPTRSPDTKAAINYLVASGATAISIVEIEGGCAFRLGHKIDPNAVEIYWLTAAQAKPLARLARKEVARHPDIATASAALALDPVAHRRPKCRPGGIAVRENFRFVIIDRAARAMAARSEYLQHVDEIRSPFLDSFRKMLIAEKIISESPI